MNNELMEILRNYTTLFRKQIERVIVLIMEEEKEYLGLKLPVDLDLDLQENLNISMIPNNDNKKTAIEYNQIRNRNEHKIRANVSQAIEEYMKNRPRNLFFNKKDGESYICINELFKIIAIVTREMRHAYQNELTMVRKDIVNVDALLWIKEDLALTQSIINQNKNLLFREQDAYKYMYRKALEYIDKYTGIKNANHEAYVNIETQVQEEEKRIIPVDEIMWNTPEGEYRAVDYLNKLFAEKSATIPEEMFKDSILRYEYNLDRTPKDFTQLMQDKKEMLSSLNKSDINYDNQINLINNIYEAIAARKSNWQEKRYIPQGERFIPQEKEQEKDKIQENAIEEKEREEKKLEIQEPEKPAPRENKVLVRESHEKEFIDYASGKNIKEIEEIFERKSGKYYIKTEIISKEKSYMMRSVMHVNNLNTEKTEEAEYTRDNIGNETYIYIIEKQIQQKIMKSNNETIIENYKDGTVAETYKYDGFGNAIIPMENMNQLPTNFIENTFRKLVPNN